MHHSSRGGQKGNAFLETGLIILPFLALIMAVVDFGLAIFLQSTCQHAVREGVRYAVTYQTASGLGHDASIKAVVQRNAMGFLSGDSGAGRIHIRYYDPVTFGEKTGVGSNAPGSVIEVSVEDFRWDWIMPLMRSRTPLNIIARSADRMESLPTGSSPPSR